MNTKLVSLILIGLSAFGLFFGLATPYMPIAFAQTSEITDTVLATPLQIHMFFGQDSTSEITNVVLQWMPLIILFAILGMILGMLKKLGKW
jgi:hypothetical protein